MCGALFAFLVACVFAATALRAQTTDPQSRLFAPPIHVFFCKVTTGEPNLGDRMLRLQFRNDSRTTLASIVWRAKYGSGWIDFPDRGKFSPGIVINRQVFLTEPRRPFDFSTGAFKQKYIGSPSPENCSLIEATGEDGTGWGVKPEQSASIPPWPSDSASPMPASIDNPLHDPVGIIGCQYTVGVKPVEYITYMKLRGQASLYVRFRNLAQMAITQVVFRVPYGAGGIDFVEVGTFAPGVLVKSDRFDGLPRPKLHRDDLPITLPWPVTSLDEADNCTTVNVQFADGTTWQNPTIGLTPAPLPTVTPSTKPQ